MDDYAQFPKVGEGSSSVTYAIDNKKITMPPAPTGEPTRRCRKSTMGARCAYCTPGSTCPSCRNIQAMSKYGVRPVVRSQIQEANRMYDTMFSTATERPTFRYYY